MSPALGPIALKDKKDAPNLGGPICHKDGQRENLFRGAGEVYRCEEPVRARVLEFLVVALVRFMLGLPHAETVIALGVPVFQVLHDDFFLRAITLDTLENHLSFAIIPLCSGDTGVGIDVPRERRRVGFNPLPFEWIELRNDIVQSSFLRRRNTGIVGDDDPGISASGPIRPKVARDPHLGAIQFHIFVLAFIHLEHKVGPAEVFVLAMSRRMIVEVAGTEHVATARFDVCRSDVEIGLR